VTPVYELGPSGALPGAVTIRFAVDDPFPADAVALVATQESSTEPWSYFPGRMSDDRRSVTVQTDHFSLFTVIRATLADLGEVFKTQFAEALTGGLVQDIKKPKCKNEAQARRDGYSVSSTQSDVVYWCFGVEGGKHVLKVVGHRRYPLLVAHPGASVMDSGSLWKQWSELSTLSRAVSENNSILFSGEQLTYDVGLDPGGSAKLSTEFDGIGNWLSAVQASVTGLLLVYSVLGGGMSQSERSFNAWFEAAEGVLDTKDCAATLGRLEAGEVLVKCILPVATDEAYFGSWVLVLGPLITSASLVAWLHGQINALVDVATTKDRYSIAVTREAADNSLLNTSWAFHGGGISIGERTATLSAHVGCPDDLSTHWCESVVEFEVKPLATGVQLTVTSAYNVDTDNDQRYEPGEDDAVPPGWWQTPGWYYVAREYHSDYLRLTSYDPEGNEDSYYDLIEFACADKNNDPEYLCGA